jgi:hypothetical protein
MVRDVVSNLSANDDCSDILIKGIIDFLISDVDYDGLENSDAIISRIIKTIAKS